MAPTVSSKVAEKKQGKKKAKADRPPTSTGQDAALGTENTEGEGDSATNGTENSGESPYLKELNKNIRNIVKKLAACNKTEIVIADAPGLTLDDLIAKKKINADQKAQVLKKPALLAELSRLEDQVLHYRKFGKDYEERYNKEKAVLQASQSEAVAKARQESADETATLIQKKADENLLVLSQFLHAAAAKRDHDEVDPVEKAAFEGVLLLVYQGNGAALAAFKDIAAGSANKVSNTSGEELDFTYEQIKTISLANAPGLDNEEGENATSEANASATETDPTIVHAGLTELEDTVPHRAVATDRDETLAIPVQSSIAPEAANAVAERKWDPQSSIVSETPSGEGWVEVPRDPAETDTGVTATPAAIHNSVSWAEEVNADAVAAEKPAENDGFEQVVHRGGRGRGSRGEFRGRGRGDYRGRGRGDGERRGGGRGRGRGDGGRRGDSESHNARQSRGSSGGW